MNAALPVAEQMLRAHGEFYPYGHVMAADGRIVSLTAYDGRERPPSAALMQMLKEQFVSGAATGEYRATALVYDVRVQLPGSSTKSDAIAVAIDHKDKYSIVVYVPYALSNGLLTTGTTFAERGKNDVFTK